MLPLKPLSVSAVPAALAKAERYRLLNEPDQAVSICEDILAALPGHGPATIVLVLALTDQFSRQDGHLLRWANDLCASLTDPYERIYYGGLVAERSARALLERGSGPGRLQPAGQWLHRAMAAYEEADTIRPAGNDDARLRWNACARLVNAHPELTAAVDEPTSVEMLE
jgi:hypothetical protein